MSTDRAGVMGRSVVLIDRCAVGVFAFEGGLIGAAAGLDLFGVMVVAIATGMGGGVIRDLLLGDVPPPVVASSTTVVVGLVGGVTAFATYSVVEVPSGVLVAIDAVGLSLFAVSGATKAMAYKAAPLVAVLLGVVTAVGGGVVRDVLLAEVPQVLVAQVYATAALAGAAVAVVGLRRSWPRYPTLAAAMLVCFVLRVVSYWQDWSLPTAT